MTPTQQRLLVLWAALLISVLCLGLLPVSRFTAVLAVVVIWGSAAVWVGVLSRRENTGAFAWFSDLPGVAYRQPVVLVCGDLPGNWPDTSPVLTVSQGCWIRVDNPHDLAVVTRELLSQRPGWGRQLSVMVCVCPQQHGDQETLTSRLLALRWQISQLHRITGQAVPLLLSSLVGSAMVKDMHWQSATPEGLIRVWNSPSVPETVTDWLRLNTQEPASVEPTVLMSSLANWFSHYVQAVFIDTKPDMPPIKPTAVAWGISPVLAGSLSHSVWREWLHRHTALNSVAGWHPVAADNTVMPLLPDFILPLLPEGEGVTPAQRMLRNGFVLFTLSIGVALASSAWNNQQLLQRISFDLQHYHHIGPADSGQKAQAVNVLRLHATQLNSWARNGSPLHLSLGLYRGEHLRAPVMAAIQSYVAPVQPVVSTTPETRQPNIIHLDSMSLFDAGKSELKPGSTKVLVNALVGVKARPGWLIRITGHTDNTGSTPLNQALSLKRAESVRDWMRDTGEIPENCFAVLGHGASRPVATNDTAEGRALNRRVEINLVPQANACLVAGLSSAPSQDGGVSRNEME
ncbi:membrane protein [Mangrovibacter sp. MFB070]|uniref:OmpA family protein n=1 Tax=Mangrovibacter sp. MFB070 TaxID=1224318 RepID=UPI0004D511F4|nr:OmpA family protein [Mangrovibacter sp. MFB070]KEA51920.1 membrane protein [Mangrovibacter sp. MFB070]